ncbi:MAG: GFA family protein [Gammaproteobacteria bacterium]
MGEKLLKHRGGCHCGAVRFEFLAPEAVEVLDCNCSICSRSRFLHLIVPQERFTLLAGKDGLGDYQFGTRAAHHYFCKQCGVKSFYRPRSHPDAYSVNLRCIEQATVGEVAITTFDGRNWEQARAQLEDASSDEH